MKIQILSDIHNEHYRNGVIPSIPPCDSDVVVLAGDIGSGTAGVRWASSESLRLGKPIIYIAGNHEYFDKEYYYNLKEMRAAASSGLSFLENNAIVIDGVRFLGCTLWSDFAVTGDQKIAMDIAGKLFHDYKLIQIDSTKRNGVLRPEDTLALNQVSVKWLKSALSKDFSGKTVVVTHFAPSLSCQHPAFSLNNRSAYFMSDLDDLIEQADLWLFGHTHHCYDDYVNGTRVVANQQGYPFKVVNGFNPVLIVTV